jgi:uncharacterized protein
MLTLQCEMRDNLYRCCRVFAAAALVLLIGGRSVASPAREQGGLCWDTVPAATFTFGGVLGQRVKANVEHWLLPCPEKNPELLEVYAHREANHEPPLVPWVGEFAGKYLISAVQAMRMSDDPRLRSAVGKVVDRIIQLQAADGYLGCWPKNEQLLKHWDLWENYHVMLGLILWSEQTGDKPALAAARRAADLICRTYLDARRPAHDAGSPEMNMGIIHGLAILYRITGEPRYLDMAKAVLKDFEQAGDYYRTGLRGEEFFRTPRPRWESLHSLQGMAELYRITGDESFRCSFLNHWASIRRFDVHNTGGFSSGEQATGNPFANAAIETCCVVAWEAVMIDALRLTGDSTIADDLELATSNAVAGAQHPSGEWCTYNTPMNGRRIPSHVGIAFQIHPGGKFLNCCSVNGPRGLGMLSEWAVTRNGDSLAVNFYGPMRANIALADGTPVAIKETSDYPLGETARLKVSPQAAKQFTLALRIPAWSLKTAIALNGKPIDRVKAGEYLKLTRTWQAGDEIALRFDFRLRYESGDLEQAGMAAVYRGPILLCADDRFKTDGPGKLDVAKLNEAKLVPNDSAILQAAGSHRPWLVLDVPTANGKSLRLVDFASAGATGKEYQSWLPAVNARPPRPASLLPVDGAKLRRGPVTFSWRSPARELAQQRCAVVISDSRSFERPVVSVDAQEANRVTVPADKAAILQPGKTYYWKIIARNPHGQSESIAPYKRFTIEEN